MPQMIHIRLGDELYNAVIRYSKATGISISDVIRSSLMAYMIMYPIEKLNV